MKISTESHSEWDRLPATLVRGMRVASLRGAILAACVTTNCAAPLDYFSSPVVVGLTVEDATGAPIAGETITIAQPQDRRNAKRLLEAPRADWHLPSDRIAALVTDRHGSVEYRFSSYFRACPLYLVPPLLTLLCDRSEYVLIALGDAPPRGFALGTKVKELGAPADRPVAERWNLVLGVESFAADAPLSNRVGERPGDSQKVLSVTATSRQTQRSERRLAPDGVLRSPQVK